MKLALGFEDNRPLLDLVLTTSMDQNVCYAK